MIRGIQEISKDYHGLLEIDANLDRLVRRIELLNYVNPLNIEKEKQRFFASKYRVEPAFKYPKLKFDPYKLHRLFYSQRLERIQDDVLRQLYQEIVYYYSNMVQCIETIGQGKQFYFNSLKVYGTPTERDVQNAKYILHFDEDGAAEEDYIARFSPEEARDYFEAFCLQYDFPLKVKFSTNIAADAMVSNSSQTLLLKRNTKFSHNQLLTLAHHEIGVHLVTTFNGLLQPLKIFSNGFPNTVETQEGLAVFSEYMSGVLTLRRLRELAYRVIASDSLIKGYNFADTFDLIHNQYKLDRESAFGITLRAHRGGGFTKDRLYLSGLRDIYKKYTHSGSLDTLLVGKVSLEYEPAIKYLQDLGLAQGISYRNHAFDENNNSNDKLEFILNNLK